MNTHTWNHGDERPGYVHNIKVTIFFILLALLPFLYGCYSLAPTAYEREDFNYPEVPSLPLIDWHSGDDELPLEPELHFPHGSLKAMTFSPDGNFLAGSSGKDILIWNVQKQNLVRIFEGSGDTITDLRYSPKGEYLASSLSPAKIILHDSRTGEIISTIEERKKSYHMLISFSADGKYIAGLSDKEDLYIYSVPEGKKIQTLSTSQAGGRRQVLFSPEGSHITSVSGDSVSEWNLKAAAKGGPVPRKLWWSCTEPEAKKKPIIAAAYSPDGRFLAAAKIVNDGTLIKVWDRSTRELVLEINTTLKGYDNRVESGNRKTNLFYTADASYLVLSLAQGAGRGWNAYFNAKTGTRVSQKISRDGGGSVFSPKGRHSAREVDSVIEILDIKTNEVIAEIGSPETDLFREARGAQYSPSQDIVAIPGEPGTIYIRDLRTWEEKKLLELPEKNREKLYGIIFSPDGSRLSARTYSYSVNMQKTETIFIWNTSNWIIERKIEKEVDSSSSKLFFSPEGDYLFSSREKGFWVLDADTGDIPFKELESMYNRQVSVWAPDGQTLFGGTFMSSIFKTYYNGDRIHMWDAATGKKGTDISLSHIEERGDYISGLRISPDKKHLLCFMTGKNEVLLFFDLETHEHVHTVFLDTARFFPFIYTPDGTKLAGYGFDKEKEQRELLIFDTETWKILAERELEKNPISLAFTPDGQGLILDSRLFWYHEKDKTVSIINYTNGHWFAIDEKNRFDCSAEFSKNLKFVKGLSVYEPEQFWNYYFAPGIISGRYYSETEPALVINEALENIPEVSIESVPREDSEEVAHVVVTGKEGDNGLGHIFISHNGRVIDEKSRALEIVRTGSSVSFHIPLIDGMNMIRGGAYDRDGSVYGLSNTLYITYLPPVIDAPDMHIFAVGVGDYMDEGLRLGYPDEDAEAIAGMFSEIAGGLYDEVNTFVLTNEKADKSSIETVMENLIKEVESRDTVVIFFAGHGYVRGDHYFFLPYDTDLTSLNQTAVTITTFGNFIKDLPANKVIMLLDTCRSGSAVQSLGTIAMSRAVEEKRQIANLAKAKGIAVFSAASESQAAYEISHIGHGLFTHSILEAVENRQDEISIEGNITVGKLLSTVNSLTRAGAMEYLGIEQSPSVYLFGEDFLMGRVK